MNHRTRPRGSNRVLLALLATTFLPARAAHAEDPTAPYVADALAGNLELRRARLDAGAAGEGVREARGGFLPKVDLQARLSYRSGALLDLGPLVEPVYQTLNQLLGEARFPEDIDVRLPQATETKLVVTQPIFAPAILHNLRIQEGGERTARATVARTRRDVVAAVRATFWSHARATRVVELLDETRPVLEEAVRVSERLVAANAGTQEAVARAQAELAELLRQRLDAERAVSASRRQLNFLAGRPLEAPVPVPADELADAAGDGLDATLAAAVSAARERLTDRAERRELQGGLDQARGAVRVAQAAYLPTLGVAAEYGFVGDSYDFGLDEDYLVVSASLTWNLFRGGQDRARVQQARLLVQKLETRRAELDRELALQAEAAIEAAGVARRAIDVAAARVAAARESFRLARRRFELGSASLLEFTDSRAALTRAELDQIVTRADVKLALVELERVASLEPPAAGGTR